MDVDAFRAEFPVLERRAYLNTGTDGPIPRRGLEAAQDSLRIETENGRAGSDHWERVAPLLGCDTQEVALTRAATDGINAALHALGLGPGDEIVTSDEEHPGLLAPLGLARRRGVDVRVVPFDELADAVRPTTTLVACSHVSWVSGQVA